MANHDKQNVHSKKDSEVHLRLELGSWTDEVPYFHRRIFIANALNFSILNGEIIISGYLIAEKSIYLIFQNDQASMGEFFHLFESYLSQEIENFLSTDNDDFPSIDHMGKLFKKKPLVDHYLIKLLTGKKLNLKYHNPEIEKMKDYIFHHDFCSAKDYRGEIGPVIIKSLSG